MAWDVRTKNVTYDVIPTINGVRGLANYGPTAALFTLGPNNTVQQYDVSNPAMVANTQHLPAKRVDTPMDTLSTSSAEPALTAETLAKHTGLENANLEKNKSTVPKPVFEKADNMRREYSKAPSSGYGTAFSSSTRDRHTYAPRPPRSNRSGTVTTFSTSSPGPSIAETMNYGFSPRYAASTTSAGSGRRPSRLRNELLPDAPDEPIKELFPYTRSRVNNVPFSPPRRFDDPNLGLDELRKQMLGVVFGWEGDIADLIRDERKLFSCSVYLYRP